VVAGQVAGDDVEEDGEGVDGLDEVSARHRARGEGEPVRTIAILTPNRNHGGSSQEVSKRWLGSQRSSPNLKARERDWEIILADERNALPDSESEAVR
jgi:hypothetical protein